MSPSKKKPLWERPWKNLDAGEKTVRKKVLKIMRTMRNTMDKDLEKLAGQRGLTVKEVLANTNAIHKDGNLWTVDSHDTISRHWEFFENGKAKSIYVNDSQASSLIAQYFNAVKRLWRYGDISGLKKFEGVTIKDENGIEHVFETDPEKIIEILERIEDFEQFEYYNSK